MKNNFKEKVIFFLDDNATKTGIALLLSLIVTVFIDAFISNLIIRLFAFYLAYFVTLIGLNKYVKKNKGDKHE